MSTPSINRKKHSVVLKQSGLSVPVKIEKARYYAGKITGNPHFIAPQPTPADILSAAQQLEVAWEASRDGSRTATRTMYNREGELDRLIAKLGNYVEDLANETNIPDMIITSAGMEFRLSPGRGAQDFAATNGNLKGVILVTAKAVRGKSGYEWQMRPKGIADWTTAAITVQARYTFSNLTSGNVYEFRQRTITKSGAGDWSGVEELMAH